MTMHFNRIPVAVLLCLLMGLAARAQEVAVAPANGTGLYKPGEQIRWTVEVTGSDAREGTYIIKQGGLTESYRGTMALKDGRGEVTAQLDGPGQLMVEVSVPAGNGKSVTALGGAIAEPWTLKPAKARPADFDAFWKAKIKELKAVPMNTKLTDGESGKPGVDYQTITMDNIRGSHINGQLARPHQGKKFPAMLIVQWAGVYPLQKAWVTDRAAEGWLVLNIEPHDLPIDKPDEFYRAQASGPLADYTGIGNDDRETSYFLRMYLSCYRGAEYLSKRPDWDGRTLVVTGTSQGGMQTIVTAGLHPKITAGMACVPAGCDLHGPEAGRLPGWPSWYYKTQGKDEAKVREAARYFDLANFAPRVKAPMLVCGGLVDIHCPLAGIYATCNQFKGPKEVVILPVSGHSDIKNSHGPYLVRFQAWKDALVKGLPAPVK